MGSVKPHIVVVNDDPTQLELVTRIIEQDGARVLPFLRAKEALAHIAQSTSVDLIVTDLRMPGIDGWRFCRLLRSSEFPQTCQTPILVISATFSRRDVEMMTREVGADAFLAMPYTPQELQDTVRELLQHHPLEIRSTVLIVGNRASERNPIAASFAGYGYRVLEATDNSQALDLFSKHRPDAVVLDHHPPQVVGMDLVSKFKCLNRHAVVIVIAADRSSELAVALTLQGADAYIHKPYEIAYLIDLVGKAKQGQAILHVEDTLETWAQEALRNAKRIQQLNNCFLSLGTDYKANIQELTSAVGDLLNAHCALYNHKGPPAPYKLAYWKDPSGKPSSDQMDGSFCLDIAPENGSQPLVVRHLQETPYADTVPCVRSYGLQTYVECPVQVEGRNVGLLCVGYVEDRDLSTKDLNMLQMLAHAIGRQEQMRQRDQELVALNEIGRVVASTFTLDQVLTLLRSKVRDVIGAEACSITLIDPSTGELVFRQADAPLAKDLVGRRLEPGQGIAGLVAHTGQSVLVPDTSADPRFYDGVDAVTGFSTREIICAPLIAQDKTIGVIEVLNKRQGKFTKDDVRLVESVAAQTASAIENARLHEATQRELVERVKADRALRESKQRLQVFIDAAPDLIYLKDRELRYLLVNQAFADFWGIEPNEFVGKTDLDFMPAAAARAYRSSDQRVIKEQRGDISEEQRADKIYETHKVPVIDEDGRTTGIAGIIRDITDRRQLQDQLIREQKHESILTLARGIAHDFNNALVGIVGNIDILRMDLPADLNAEQTLQAMEQSAQRMTTLTSQLLAYAGGGRHQPQRLNLNEMIGDALRRMHKSIQPNISVQSVLDAELWEIEADLNQIRQVLTNLFTNACEAMAEKGGSLSVHTENVRRETWACTLGRQHPAGEYVRLTVADTGHGMDRQVTRRLFEPFFSTRFLGRGLGLAAAMGIVRDHKGCIEVESETGKGTAVHVCIPRRVKAKMPAFPDPETAQSGTILVVEDDQIVRNLVQRALSRRGYTIILTEDGERALRVYDQLEAEIDLVLLDLGLPGIDGEDVLRILRARDPDVPVLLTSGYHERPATQNIELGDKTRFIQKPFTVEALSDTVRIMLEDKGQSR